jgi:hypothetical protein
MGPLFSRTSGRWCFARRVGVIAPVASTPDRAWAERLGEGWGKVWSEESWRSMSDSMGWSGAFREMKGGELALLGGSVGEREFGGVGRPPRLEGRERVSR